jgi:hypothetical protein
MRFRAEYFSSIQRSWGSGLRGRDLSDNLAVSATTATIEILGGVAHAAMASGDGGLLPGRLDE